MKESIFKATRKDFRVDTFKSGGKGGQHQNKTDSGVRITHTETGLSCECRESRSQQRNKSVAFKRLAQKLVSHVLEKERRDNEISNETIRTYHCADNRVKDHKSGHTQPYQVVMNDIGPMVEARRLAMLGR